MTTPNYETLTPEREAERQALQDEAGALWLKARRAGFMLRMDVIPDPDVPLAMGVGRVRVCVDPTRKLAIKIN